MVSLGQTDMHRDEAEGSVILKESSSSKTPTGRDKNPRYSIVSVPIRCCVVWITCSENKSAQESVLSEAFKHRVCLWRVEVKNVLFHAQC